MTVLRFDPTPNPNALKCVVDGSFGPSPRSYFTASEAAGDDIASAIFALGGVTNILMNADWITVSKEAGAAWEPIRAGVERVLAGFDGH